MRWLLEVGMTASLDATFVEPVRGGRVFYSDFTNMRLSSEVFRESLNANCAARSKPSPKRFGAKFAAIV